ncbi:MAG: YbaB/EbfC family nucleoid-associated protein [Spirochaetaceae bacterium]|jgi:DNA-binding YbaB/EbfC family protein|nr:YbaB/EbfC family nucleoid-associated protein [Spirochaetaceae bacterium]
MNPLEMFKNAQKIQEQMVLLQEKLGEVIITGCAGGGMVEVDMNGRMEPLAVRIAPEIVNKDEVLMLQELIISAFSDAVEKAREFVAAEVGGNIPANLNIPGFPL